MSIENFEGKYPLNQELLDEIIRREKKAGMSPVACLARNFAMEAGSGLKELLSPEGKDDKIRFALDEKRLEGLPRDLIENIKRHLAGVIYGASIVVLERAMVEGYFDVGAWCSLYNMGTAGTMLAQKAKEREPIENLTREHLLKMQKFSSEHKTYSGFFTKEEGFALLPKNLKTIFGKENILSFVKREIIPIFEPRAALLIATQRSL